MSHYDPANMPAAGPPGSGGPGAQGATMADRIGGAAVGRWRSGALCSRRLREADLAKLTLEAATPTVEIGDAASVHRRAGVDPAANVERSMTRQFYARVNGYLKELGA